MKRRAFSLIVCLILLYSVGFSVLAHDVPDLSRKGSISITMRHGEGIVPGGTLTLYRVGAVAEEDGNYSFVLTGPFAESGISLTDIQSPTLAGDLAEFAKSHDLPGETNPIDSNAQVKFEDLETGLYLFVQYDPAPGYNPANPFLVSLPGMVNGTYIYDVDGSPKLDPITERPPTEPEETKPSDPTLPQTGQLNWPIPVLAVSGMILCTLGWVLFFGEKRKNEPDSVD